MGSRRYQNIDQRYLIELMLQIRGYATDLTCKVDEIERTMGRRNNLDVLNILSEASKQLFEVDDKLREIMLHR